MIIPEPYCMVHEVGRVIESGPNDEEGSEEILTKMREKESLA